jgi:hypothetical protein|tara:strand:+ start:476 stop:808 length:333 start_codon:yes stop_codon:yes gene_type:complete
MSDHRENYSILSFGIDSKLHENLKIRLYYDQIRNQSEFFRYCVESYLEQNPLFMEFLDDYKINKKVQSKARTTKSRKLRAKGEKMLQDLALTETEIENIFDILEEELPEL